MAGRLDNLESHSNSNKGRQGNRDGATGLANNRKPKTCFSCGQEGHFANVCTNTPKLKACYACGQTGHRAYNCPSANQGQNTHWNAQQQGVLQQTRQWAASQQNTQTQNLHTTHAPHTPLTQQTQQQAPPSQLGSN